MDLVKLINENWKKTVRNDPPRGDFEDSGMIPLPYPYTSPTIDNYFSELFYWDTYFTNVGLLLSGEVQTAIYNVENIAYLINKLGYMPNGSHEKFIGRSQPPFFSLMVKDVYEKNGDKAFLLRMYKTVEREYEFWQTKRMTECGLNQYSHSVNKDDKADVLSRCEYLCTRYHIDVPVSDEEKYNYARCIIINCESGWDCNSRMGLEPYNFAHIDLNSLLFGIEKNMEYFAAELENGEESHWRERSDARALLLKSLCKNERGFYSDYNFVKKKPTDFLSVASFYPLFVGMLNQDEAHDVIKHLPSLEFELGISASEKRDDLMDLQWDYPFAWPCMHYIVCVSLIKYGYRDDAIRIAKKYISLVEKNYDEMGDIFEKYEIIEGRAKKSKENKILHPMMGWSAGVYLWCKNLIS